MTKAYFVCVREAGEAGFCPSVQEKGGTVEQLMHLDSLDGTCVLLIARLDEDLDWFIEGCKYLKLLGL